MPNAILDQALVPEILQVVADAAPLVAAVRLLLDSTEASERQLEGFGRVRRLMEQGTTEDPRTDPAERVLQYWSPTKK